jgi:3-dehydroquinate dehydratase-2
MIQKAYGKYDGIVINPAAYTHTSIAVLDALKAVGLPAVEVHLSDIEQREDFRKHSVTVAGCIAQVAGLGFESYREGLKKLKEYLEMTM